MDQPPQQWQLGLLLLGSLERAGVPLAILQQIWQHEATTQKVASFLIREASILNHPLDEFYLGYRARKGIRRTIRRLSRAEFPDAPFEISYGDLCSLSAKDLLDTPNFGRASLREVEEALARVGLKLKDD